jgi:EAL domain-containing protein (putative c-di-GMP-specific phosphodiesterase class I)/GGDEF domain-containing protein
MSPEQEFTRPDADSAPLTAARGAELVRALCDPNLLHSAFQPIFSAGTGELEGCEALIRLPLDSGFKGPYEAFKTAFAVGLGVDFEIAATIRTLTDAELYAGTHRLFLNLLAPVFSDPRYDAAWLVDKVLGAGRVPSQVILEIPEISRVNDYSSFSRALEPYRREGFRIAIDDFGAGYTNLRMITDLSPDFVKIDRVFIEGISSNARKRILVESVVTLCHRTNCWVVAEGIETAEDLETVRASGVDFLQGFLLARPAPAEEAFLVDDLALPVIPGRARASDLSNILVSSGSANAEDRVSSVVGRMVADPTLDVVPVLLRHRAVGLVSRENATHWLDRKDTSPADPVSLLVEDSEFDQVPEGTALEAIADLIRRRPSSRRFAPIVVTGPGNVFRGVLPLDALLCDLLCQKAEDSLHLHPVTRLPGRRRLEEVLTSRLRLGSPFALARLNVRRFRPFNDRYGFLRGDKLLASLASLLRDQLAKEQTSFLAHYDADDFSFVVSTLDGAAFARSLPPLFTAMLGEHYEPEVLAAGTFVGRDRGGALVTIPLMSLALGLTLVEPYEGLSVRAVEEDAEAALKAARAGKEPVVLRYLWLPSPSDKPPATQVSLPKPRIP